MFSIKRKNIFFLSLLILSTLKLSAQYYYEDLYKTNQTNKTFQKELAQQIKEVHILSFTANNQPIEGFKYRKTIDSETKQTYTIAQSAYSKPNYTITYFNAQNNVYHIIDSNSQSINDTRIYYNTAEKIDSLVFLSYGTHPGKQVLYGTSIPDTIQEKHAFFYLPNGALQKMIRYKNHRPYKTIYFEEDSLGQVFKEYEKKSPKPIYYYRYKEGKLTDIFHFSYTQKKMIPDYLFTYNRKGLLTQKTVVNAEQHNFLEWHFTYNPENQIESQTGINKEKEIQGYLKYKYIKQP